MFIDLRAVIVLDPETNTDFRCEAYEEQEE
jgi:hypothetical protein